MPIVLRETMQIIIALITTTLIFNMLAIGKAFATLP